MSNDQYDYGFEDALNERLEEERLLKIENQDDDKFHIDGSSREKVGDFMQWKVVDEDGNIVCTFYGPRSLQAAGTFCDALNKKVELDIPDCADLIKRD